MRDLSRYHAAVGDFQVIVDLEHDVAWVPDVVAGNRTLFVAAGSVSAYVDLEGLRDEALTVDTEQRTVQVRLPEAKLDKPNIDQERTYLYSQERGVWDRVKAGLADRAARNTRAMLTGMFQSLGYHTLFAADNA